MRRSRALRMGALAPLALTVPAVAQPLVKMRVGLGVIEAHAQGYYAQDIGFFRKAGLDVELQQLNLGAIVAESVAQGGLDAGQANLFSLIAGRQHGIPFVAIAPSGLIDNTDPPHDLVVVTKDSPITTVKELNGQTIGLLSIGGTQQMYVVNFVDKSGGDSSTLKFLAVGAAGLAPAVVSGRVAAVDLPDPQLTAARDQTRPLGNAYAALAPRFLEGAWFTTAGWLAKNKDTARRFAGAIVAAGQWSMANPEAAGAILSKYLKVKFTHASLRFGTTLDPALIQPICDTAARYKMLAPSKASHLIWDGK
jgi:NitT/TauT family transport system substrate-binding protein